MQNSNIRLIVDVAESVRTAALIQKDAEAAQLIGSEPDALYFLVQPPCSRKRRSAVS